jgi:two-component system chemotaxis response regulator CheY
MPRGSRRALVVDDQPNIRRVVRVYLETVHKCEVIEAGNGVEAIKQLLAAPVDLIITDLVMPEMTGLELVGYVRRHDSFRTIPIVMLTSQGDETDRRKAITLGVSDYLIKPFAPLSMKPVIEKYLQRHA